MIQSRFLYYSTRNVHGEIGEEIGGGPYGLHSNKKRGYLLTEAEGGARMLDTEPFGCEIRPIVPPRCDQGGEGYMA